ncbi:MAG: prolyl oligopeptidase family serine peptidase, partial [Halobacteriaceae archaeon]
MGDLNQTSSSDIDPEQIARLPEFYSPQLSPENDKLAFYHDKSGRMELYSMDLSTGEWSQWSEGNVPRNLSGGIKWDESNERIYYHVDQDGNEQNDIHAITPDGKTEPVIEVDGQSYIVAVDPDNTFLLYVSDEQTQLNVYVYDKASGKSRKITNHSRPVWPWQMSLSPDGEKLAYVTNESEDPQNQDVYVTEIADSEPRQLDIGENGAEATVADWFPDGKRLLIGDNSTNYGRVGMYDLESDQVEWLSDNEVDETPGSVAPDGSIVTASRTRNAATTIGVYQVASDESYEIDLAEGVTSHVGGAGEGFIDDRTVCLVHQSGAQRRYIVTYDIETDTSETLIEARYGDIDPNIFVEPEYIRYESEDGLEIGALLYEPHHRVESNTSGPAVVYPHGGPIAQSKRSFDTISQYLVEEGYTVLRPNYRGSTGRGREFKERIRNDWGGMEQIDIRRGGEWLAAHDRVDGDRIAVYGISYGGYSAYCQLTMHPGPWAAGVAWVGMTDLSALYEESMPHFQSLLEDQLGDPEDNEAFYRDRSPIEHVENLTAPLYILHGKNDPRCPISQ